MLPAITRITFGTGYVSKAGEREHVRCIRRAMDAKVWMHCANYDEGVFPNLKRAFAEAPSQIPRTIFKVDGVSAAGFRQTIRSCLAETGLTRMDIAQVCGFPLSNDPEAVLDAMREAKEAGLADHYVMEIMPAYCVPMVAWIIPRGLFDGYILYHNVMCCRASPAALSAMAAKSLPLLCLQTFGGGNGLWNPANRPAYLDPIYRKSGCRSWVDFSVRYGLSLPDVVTTIAGTGKIAHLEEILRAGETFQPLQPALVNELLEAHHAWNRAHNGEGQSRFG